MNIWLKYCKLSHKWIHDSDLHLFATSFFYFLIFDLNKRQFCLFVYIQEYFIIHKSLAFDKSIKAAHFFKFL